MKNNLMEYNGYYAKIEYSDEDGCFFGKLMDIDDLVLFEGETVEELKKDFKEAVDYYIESCNRDNKEPKKQYKGSFNVRIKPELHKQAVRISKSLNISLNQFVERAISEKIKSK